MRFKELLLAVMVAFVTAEYDKYLGRDLAFYAGATYRLQTAKVWSWTYSKTYPLIDGADFRNRQL